ncbi:NEDD4-binding protein 1-like [Temnothorax curvispinosus]|uniref:NEDD4-binding protein 1-like n=1 Tax=Temnothorax curvispinosus TaxID=300111 RepID=A0A6J1PJB4_9HYME|nr:NEDD4-binding protein 1-like [Temnothorax curvispinosus]
MNLSECRDAVCEMKGKKTRYESPLKGFKKSLEELTSIVGDIVCQKRLGHGTVEKLKEQSATDSSSKDSSSQNNVIVINDSDSETSEGDNDNETNDKDADTSLSVIECVSKPSPSPKRRQRKLIIHTRRKKSRPSIIPLDTMGNDSSVLDLSVLQESLNEENIAPTQTEDDVVELWSCLEKPVKKMRVKRKSSCARCKKDPLFMIDKTPNMKNLEYLKTNTHTKKYTEKSRKKQDLSWDKTTSESFIPLTVKPSNVKLDTLKCSNSNKRKRQHADIVDPSPTKSNAHHSKKKIYLGEKNWRHGDNLDSSFAKMNAHQNKRRIYWEERNSQTKSTRKLREIIVDGCNVAMAHTNGKEFSEKGIQIVVDFFKLRGHNVKVFLPQHVRKKEHTFLEKLYKEGTVVFTPSRLIDGIKITSYDDRYILKYATSCGGIVISTDQYRDLYREKPEWRSTILNRLLIPTFVGDYIMFPEDPLGRFGPNLETFLRH